MCPYRLLRGPVGMGVPVVVCPGLGGPAGWGGAVAAGLCGNLPRFWGLLRAWGWGQCAGSWGWGVLLHGWGLRAGGFFRPLLVWPHGCEEGFGLVPSALAALGGCRAGLGVQQEMRPEGAIAGPWGCAVPWDLGELLEVSAGASRCSGGASARGCPATCLFPCPKTSALCVQSEELLPPARSPPVHPVPWQRRPS